MPAPTPHHRLLVRAAVQLERYYAFNQGALSVPDLPRAIWQRLNETVRRWELCRRRRFSVAAEQARQRYRQQIEELITDCHCLADQLSRSPVTVLPSLPFLYAELQGLYAEFEGVRINLQEHQICVPTGRIILEDEFDLGPFEIRLKYNLLHASSPYDIVALEPNPPGSNREVSHPHVNSQVLCEGDGRAAIRTALNQGRLSDFFLLVSRILQTYNPSSAYVQLRDWDGVECSDCGDSASEYDSCVCEQCHSRLCNDCSHDCCGCDLPFCHGCLQDCTGCSDVFCRECLTPCSECEDPHCRHCLTDGLCAGCLETQQEITDEQTRSPEEAAPAATTPPAPAETAPPTGAEVHSHRLVETPVPA